MEATSLFTAAALLASSAMPAIPGLLQIDPGSQLCKASTAIEGGERVLYMEASNQARDVQNETILVDALVNSKDYFLKYGRIDLDHATVWQMVREQKLDPSNPYAREIGRPLDVRTTRQIRSGGEPSVLLKAGIFKSADKNNEFTKAADWFWNSLQVTPAVKWYPSVAGSLLPGGRVDQPDGRRVIKALRWHSVALTRNPVNPEVGEVSTVPLDVFCKALREGGDLAEHLTNLAGGFHSQGGRPDQPMKRDKGTVQDLQNAILTPEKGEIIRQAILDAVPPYRIDQWLQTLMAANITPAEGMAFLLAVLDSGHALSVSAPEKERV